MKFSSFDIKRPSTVDVIPKKDEPLFTEPPEIQMIRAMEQYGIQTPSRIIADGRIHRFWSGGKNKTKHNGWYVLNPGKYPWGRFGDWASGIDQSFSVEYSRAMTNEELEEYRQAVIKAKQQYEKDREAEAQRVAKNCTSEYFSLQPATDNHPYLVAKKVKAHDGVCIDSLNRLVIPACNVKGEITTLERIMPTQDENGSWGKRFTYGGRKQGSFYVCGEGTPAYMAEGYATAASITEATGKACVVAFDAGNLIEVAKYFPNVTIVADNDENNKGESCAKRTGLPYILIPEIGMDANDFANAGNNLKNLLEPRRQRPFLESVNSYLTQPSAEPWLIKHWVPKGRCLCMLFGASGNGKTFVAIDWMLRIATGKPDWFGEKVNPGKVLYLCGEGHRGVGKRIALWAQEQGMSQLPETMLVSSKAADLDSASDFSLVVKSLTEANNFKPDLIVIDTLNRFMGGDENSTQDSTAFIKVCSQMSDLYNACIIIIHHTGVSDEAQDRARGSSTFKGALDMQIKVDRDKRTETFTISQTKNKDGEEVNPKFLTLQQHEITGWFDEDGDPIVSAVLVQSDVKQETIDPAVSADNYEVSEVFRKNGTIVEGLPHITRIDWRDYLLAKGMDTRNVKNELNPHQERKLVSRLTIRETIVPSGFDAKGSPTGWFLKDPNLVRYVMMALRYKAKHGKYETLLDEEDDDDEGNGVWYVD